MRRAREDDLPAIESVLKASFETTMFLRSNLANYGLVGDASHVTEVFFDAKAGPSGGLLGITKGGYLMAHAAPEDTRLWSQFATAIEGRVVLGMTGQPKQVEAMFAALDLEGHGFRIDDIEPLYALDLCALPLFDGVVLRAPQEHELDILAKWRCQSNSETLGGGTDALALSDAAFQIERSIERGALRVLVVDGQLSAMTAFNAELPDCVQIGGVFTPQHLRNRGYARRAVAAHLSEARARGVEKAVLFAASEAACRTYEAIGFQQVGTYRVALFEEPMRVGQ